VYDSDNAPTYFSLKPQMKFGVEVGCLSVEAGVGDYLQGGELTFTAKAKRTATCGPASSVSGLLETVEFARDYNEIAQKATTYLVAYIMAPHVTGAYAMYSAWQYMNGTPVDPVAEVLKRAVLIAQYVENRIPIDMGTAFNFKGKLTLKASWGAHAKVTWPSGGPDEEGFWMTGSGGGIDMGACGTLGCFAGIHMFELNKFKAVLLFTNVELEFIASFKEEDKLTPAAFKKRTAKNALAAELDKLHSEILLNRQQQRQVREWLDEQNKQAKAEAKAERNAINGCTSKSGAARTAASRSTERSKPTKEEIQAAKAEDAPKRAKSKERSKSNRTKSVGRSSGKV